VKKILHLDGQSTDKDDILRVQVTGPGMIRSAGGSAGEWYSYLVVAADLDNDGKAGT
jgi:hypothetical protein